MNHSTTEVSICVVPRERFSCAVDSLYNVISNTTGQYKLVYVDANSPPAIASQLAALCREHGFTYIRKDRYMSPNEARNIGLNSIDTTFVACIDNDLFVRPGWLEALMDCARATGA
ncbi:MAG: glycosyltransferase [Haliea sp.]|nr:glycosyltransferase [Haliea sp.]MBK6740428.1 glycosyltransferase [Haliea sp.]